MLASEKWIKAKEIFQTAMDLPLAERQAFIETQANGDELIKREVETLLRECVALRRETLPPEHWLIATAEGYLAESLLQMRRFDEAAPLLREGYKILLDKLGANHEHTKQARKRLEDFEGIRNSSLKIDN